MTLIKSARSWNQHQTLTDCFCCHIDCAQLEYLGTQLLWLPAQSLIETSRNLPNLDYQRFRNQVNFNIKRQFIKQF